MRACVTVDQIKDLILRLEVFSPSLNHTRIALLLYNRPLDAPYKERQAASARLSRALSGKEGVGTYRWEAWVHAAQQAGVSVDGLLPLPAAGAEAT